MADGCATCLLGVSDNCAAANLTADGELEDEGKKGGDKEEESGEEGEELPPPEKFRATLTRISSVTSCVSCMSAAVKH